MVAKLLSWQPYFCPSHGMYYYGFYHPAKFAGDWYKNIGVITREVKEIFLDYFAAAPGPTTAFVMIIIIKMAVSNVPSFDDKLYAPTHLQIQQTVNNGAENASVSLKL